MSSFTLDVGSPDVIWSFLVAALLGFLIGLERERKRELTGSIFAGIRTFPLIAVFGAIVGHLSIIAGTAVLVVGFLAMTVLVALAYWRESSGQKIGGTTEVAILVAFGLGVIASIDTMVGALAGAVIATGILSLRKELRNLSTAVSQEDLFAVVQFATVSLVVLPLVPNESFGPWGVWNPRVIWLEVVLISGISFVGYVAIKIAGARRGIGLSGILGGLASSTAVMVTFSRRSKQNTALSRMFAVGALLASAAMVPRLIVILWVVQPNLLLPTLIPFGVLFLLTIVGSLLLGRPNSSDVDEVRITNPFELRTALEFGLLFAIVLLVARAAQEYFGAGGIYLASVLAGITRPEAIALSLANQVSQGLDVTVAVRGVAIAVAVNSVFKAGLGVAFGSRPFGRAVFTTLLVAGAASVAAAWLLPTDLLTPGT